MSWWYKIPIYFGYIVSISGLVSHFTGLRLISFNLDAGMTTAIAGLLVSISYMLYYEKRLVEFWRNRK